MVMPWEKNKLLLLVMPKFQPFPLINSLKRDKIIQECPFPSILYQSQKFLKSWVPVWTLQQYLHFEVSVISKILHQKNWLLKASHLIFWFDAEGIDLTSFISFWKYAKPSPFLLSLCRWWIGVLSHILSLKAVQYYHFVHSVRLGLQTWLSTPVCMNSYSSLDQWSFSTSSYHLICA